MMITCPRCDFVQPKDRFCANCGVDIESFKPEEPPLLTKLWNSGRTQSLIFIILITLTGYYVAKKYKKKEFTLSGIVEIFEGEDTEFDEDMELPPETEDGNETLLEDESEVESYSEEPTTSISVEEPLPTLPPNRISIVFSESEINFLNGLSEENVQGQMFKATTIKFKDSISKYLTTNPASDKLPGGSSGLLKENETIVVARAFSSNEESYGLEMVLTPTSISSNGARLRIQISLRLPPTEVDSETIDLIIEESVDLKLGNLLVISELMPRVRPLTEQEKTAFSSTPLSILSSREYQRQETDFTILITVQHE